MPASASFIPRWQRVACRLVRWALRLLLVFWLLVLATLALLHGWVMPRLSQWKPQIEAQASRWLGGPLQIGQIESRPNGLIPAVTVRHVSLRNAAGTEVLAIPEVVAAVSPRSLWRKGFEQLVFQSPTIHVLHGSDGQWQAAGQTLGTGPDTPADAAAVPAMQRASPVLEWLLTQPELLVQDAQIWLTDASTPTTTSLKLQEVQLLLRHHLRSHEIALKLRPDLPGVPALEWRAQLRRPLVSTGTTWWPRWSGQSWMQWQGVNLATLASVHHLPLLAQWREHLPQQGAWLEPLQGQASVRAWLQWQQGQVQQASLDVALQQARVHLPGAARALAVEHFSTRVEAERLPRGWSLQTRDLDLRTTGGLRWNQGNLAVRHERATARQNGQTRAQASHADLAAVARLLEFVPWPWLAQDTAQTAQETTTASPHWAQSLPAQLARWQPAGMVDELVLDWQTAPPSTTATQPPQYRVQARVQQLRLGVAADGSALPQAPAGLHGLSGEVTLTQDGGEARVQVENGDLHLPQVFSHSIPVTRLSADLHWQRSANGQMRLEVRESQWANPHAQGQASAVWSSYTDAQMQAHARQQRPGQPASRLPGVLTLHGQLQNVDAAQVHRYLPLSIPADTRRYVQEAVLQGRAPRVDFTVRGDLRRFPFDPNPATASARTAAPAEQFRIAAQLQDVEYRYVPHYLLRPNQQAVRPWPDLAGLRGELVFEGNRMQLQVQQGQLKQDKAVRIHRASARIADLRKAVVEVDVQASGPLQQQLDAVRDTPVAGYTHHLLDDMQATGEAALHLQLGIGLSKGDEHRVQGTVEFQGNRLGWWPQIPALQDLRGSLHFSEKDFRFEQLRAQTLGGSVQLDGHMQPFVSGQPVQTRIQAQGTLNAEGLRRHWPQAASPWLNALQGQTDYRVTVQTRGEAVQLDIDSSLQGIQSDLPAPLDKPDDHPMPLRIHTDSATQGLRIRLGDTLRADLAQNNGTIWVGQPPTKTPPRPEADRSGIRAVVRLPELDVHAWQNLLASADDQSAAASGSVAGTSASTRYLPGQSDWQIDRLHWQGRTLHQFQMQLSHATAQRPHWSARVQSQELVGDLDYRLPRRQPQGDAGQVTARLDYLELPESATAAATASPAPSASHQALQQLPALDVQIDRLLFARRDWGRVELQATNRPPSAGQGHEWRVSHLAIQTPEAELTAQGNWKQIVPLGNAPPSLLGEGKRTALQFQLKVHNAARLLARLGMPGVLQGGQGTLQGHLGWLGSPARLDYPSLDGAFQLRVEQGQFLPVDAGMARLLGVLNLQALPRRLSLDFRDIFSDGFAFDFVQGDFQLSQGIIRSNNLQMKGVNAAVIMEGEADILRETQDLHVVVVPEINALTASLVATAINPAIGAGSFVAQLLLSRPLASAATREFRLHGSWKEPQFERVQAGTRTGN